MLILLTLHIIKNANDMRDALYLPSWDQLIGMTLTKTETRYTALLHVRRSAARLEKFFSRFYGWGKLSSREDFVVYEFDEDGNILLSK